MGSDIDEVDETLLRSIVTLNYAGLFGDPKSSIVRPRHFAISDRVIIDGLPCISVEDEEVDRLLRVLRGGFRRSRTEDEQAIRAGQVLDFLAESFHRRPSGQACSLPGLSVLPAAAA